VVSCLLLLEVHVKKEVLQEAQFSILPMLKPLRVKQSWGCGARYVHSSDTLLEAYCVVVSLHPYSGGICGPLVSVISLSSAIVRALSLNYGCHTQSHVLIWLLWWLPPLDLGILIIM
jgi:hypothetical protein